MRIVLDTNVLISGIFFGGIPALILDRWAADRFMVYATPSIMEEYVRVTSDAAKSEAHQLLSLKWQAMLPEVCHLIPDERRPKRISRDRADDKFVFCAMNAGADFLVTGDKDLTSIERDFSFKIVSPNEFIKVLD
jgi:putative PIN family toxin of toxin-antitoxin system